MARRVEAAGSSTRICRRQSGDAEALGKLMTQAQAGMDTCCCACESSHTSRALPPLLCRHGQVCHPSLSITAHCAAVGRYLWWTPLLLCPSNVNTHELVCACMFVCMWPLQHRVLQWPTLKPFIYGGKGVGAGGDGSCQVRLLAFMLHSITTVVLTPLAAGMP